MRTLALSSACCVTLLAISACSTPVAPNTTQIAPKIDATNMPSSVAPMTENSLTGIIWKVSQVDTTPVTSAEADSRHAPSIQLNKQGNTLNGFTGCNRIFGKFIESANNALQLQVASTRMACIDADKQLLESKIQQALNETVSYQFKDKQLRFYDVKQQERLVFIHAGHAAVDSVPPANAQSSNNLATPNS